MDYQFILGNRAQPIAEFGMGGEALGHWFTFELGQDSDKVSHIFSLIYQLEKKTLSQFTLSGKEFDLLLDQEEVEVRAHYINLPGPDTLPEGTELYDVELSSGCGLADFRKMLLSWQAFVAQKGAKG